MISPWRRIRIKKEMSSNRNKRVYSSTASELDSTSNDTTLDQTTLQDPPSSPSKKGRKKKKAKTTGDNQKRLDDYLTSDGKEPTSNKDISMIEQKIDDMNKRLSKMLTKDDSSFIKDIRSTIDGMREKLLASVVKRLILLIVRSTTETSRQTP